MRKLRSLCIAALVLSIIVAGCVSKSNTQPETAANKTATGESQTTSKDATGEPKSKRLVDKDVEITVMLGESNLVPISQDMLHFKWMYEQTGIKIVFMPVPVADYNQKKSTLLSTNDLPDIIQVGQSDLNNFASTGIFVDLSKYKDQLLNFYDKVERYPEAKFTFIDGKPFGFPTLNRWDMTRASGLVVRKDIMTKLNIDPPKTFDEYYDMLKKFKAQYPDSVPYVNRNGSKNLISTLGYSLGSGTSIQYDPQAKAYLFMPGKPETKQVLAYLNNMYKEKLLDPDYISVTATQWEEKIANGTGLSYLDNVGFCLKHLTALQKIVGDAEWDLLFMPVNSFGYARGLYISPHQLGRIWAVSSESKKIPEIMKMFNWFYTEEACDMMNLGKEGEDFIRKPDGELEVTEQNRKKYSDEKGLFVQALMHKERGNAAYESFIPYSDLHSYFLATSEFQLNWYKEIQQKDKAYTFPLPTPPFNTDEREKVTSIQAQLNTIAVEMFDKLIMGVEPIDAFDKYVQKFKEKGMDELEKIYSDAYNRIK
ncbi:MAG TPA: extracellular solute-binding protein [Clostridiales bacterium]|nr:extracellular solute-binding protein [Clostridiales bacterium]